jgi:hypothetical protein
MEFISHPLVVMSMADAMGKACIERVHRADGIGRDTAVVVTGATRRIGTNTSDAPDRKSEVQSR